MVTLLLAVVAVAARGRPLGSRGGGRGGLPFSFWEYTYTTIVILAVPLLFAGALVTTLIRRRQGKRRSFGANLLISLVTWAALVAFELLVIRRLRHLHINVHHRAGRHGGTGAVNPRGFQGGTGNHPAGRTLQFRWDELVIVLVLVLVAGIVTAWLFRRHTKVPSETAPEVLAAALDESLDDLRADPDLRRAIIAAYARMEAALAAAGIPRDPAEAPLEYVERALLSLDTSAGAVRELTDLFEWARFSHHEPEPSMRDDAIDALVAVRDELRASELELTPA